MAGNEPLLLDAEKQYGHADKLYLFESSPTTDSTAELTQGFTIEEQLRRTLTQRRLCIALCFIGASLVASRNLPVETFRYMAEPQDLSSYHDCVLYCQQVHTGELVIPEWPRGGKALCEEAGGSSTIDYKECYGHKHTDCHQVNATHPRDPGRKILRTSCRFPIVPVYWMPYVTICIFGMAIALVIEGLAPEVLLVGAACLLSVLGVLTPDQVAAGFANSGVVSLAVLFPISTAITETGLLELIVNMLLGNPSSLRGALLRMILLVSLVSAFLSNTATVAMMIPIVVSWSRRLQVHPGKILMPLSYAAQLGGCLTLLGGSQCLVAKASVPSAVYSMSFFDLFPIGFCNLVAITGVITLLSPTCLLDSSLAEKESESTPGTLSKGRSYTMVMCIDDAYRVIVEVQNRSSRTGGLLGKTLLDSGLSRLDGVINVSKRTLDPSAARHGLSEELQAGDKLEVDCDGLGVSELRRHPGLVLSTHADATKLGAYRRRRFLYEAAISSSSQLLQADGDIIEQPELLRQLLGACLIAVKAPLGAQCSIGPGTVLLLEADQRFLISHAEAWASCFSLVHRVRNSSPPRIDRTVDTWRNLLTCCGMVLLIALVTADVVQLQIGGILFLMILLLIRALTIPQLLEAIRPNILLTIVGALALGTALEQSGVVTAIANCLTIAHGTIVLTALIYLLSVFLSMFINNSATIAIIGPMLVTISETHASMKLPPMVWALVYGAGSCFTTPLGYQTNLMVMQDGEYSFGDFAKFGIVIQVCHLCSTVLFTYLYVLSDSR
eukprot:TRINITY_DN5203_c0_g1_i3.p1 TRINITY_DN5203_c0_g1~~TRINITY_DN5203_c0_g1_i3.p1  ORF type:complete len:782 (+),score=56.01 TRINITY_DN5203_c0_g1_i3:44-2389(+)